MRTASAALDDVGGEHLFFVGMAMLETCWMRAALLGVVLLTFAAPGAAQDSGAAVEPASVEHVRAEAGALETSRPALFPPSCLVCASATGSRAPTLESEGLPQGVAPVIGGVVGAVVGLVAARLYCANRTCEMADLFGPLVGGLVGMTIGKLIEGSLPEGRW